MYITMTALGGKVRLKYHMYIERKSKANQPVNLFSTMESSQRLVQLDGGFLSATHCI